MSISTLAGINNQIADFIQNFIQNIADGFTITNQEIWVFYIGLKGKSLVFEDSILKLTWDLFNSGKLSEKENILLGATFDYVWVKQSDVPLLIEAPQDFNDNYVTPNNYVRTVVSASKTLQDILDEIDG